MKDLDHASADVSPQSAPVSRFQSITAPRRLALDEAAQALLFSEARTANTFTDEPVTDADLQAIYELVKFAPTALNTQPLRLLVVRSPEAKEELLPHVMPGNQAKVRAAPVTLVVAADTRFHENLPRVAAFAPHMKAVFEADPVMREKQALFNATLQAGYLLLGIRAAGLAAGPMGGFDAAGVDRALFPDGEWKSILLVNVGKPGEKAWQERLPRLDYDEVVREL